VGPAVVVFALASSACTLNTFRSPQFTARLAPSPTVATSLVKCLATSHAATDVVAAAYAGVLASRTHPVDVPSETRIQLCGELATDQAVSTWGTDWELGKTIAAPFAKSLAATEKAGSVLVSVVRTDDACDEHTCKEERVDVGAFLFAADGTLLWKGAARTGGGDSAPSQSDAEAMARELVSEVPADFRDK